MELQPGTACNYCIPVSVIQKPVRIGNSKGARIPAHLIRAYHLERGFVMIATQEGILIAPAAEGKLTLEESFAAMAADSADLKTAREWAESGLTDGLEEKD
jgi:antitoxin component of MazEF toxin-antitoxin module